MRRLLTQLLLVAVTLAVAVAPAAGAPPAAPPPDAPQFHVERLRVAGRLLSVHAIDLDADGKRDLVALYATGAPPDTRRFIALFFDRGGFHAAPDQVLPAPPGAAFVDAADVDGDARRELLYADSHGIAALSLGKGGYGEAHRLLDVAGLALLADEEDLPWLDVARDWAGDGRTSILLPLVDGIALFSRGADGAWTRAADLRLPPRATYAVRGDGYEPRSRNYSLRVGLTVPELHLGDFDGDGHADLIAALDDRVVVFRRQPGAPSGQIFAASPTARIHLGVRSEAEAARGNSLIQTTVADLDGDGIVDLIVDKVSGGISSMRSQIGFYYGRKGGGYDRPAQVVSRDGYAGALVARLAPTGPPALVLYHAPVGFAETVRIVVTRRLPVTFGVHRNLGAKGFAAKSEAERVVEFPVDYAAGADLDGPFPSLDGDFNGDGASDFAAAHGPDALAVWLGGGRALLAEYPKAIVRVPPSRYWQVLDLDADGHADVLLFYRFRAELQGQIVVLRNTGRGW